MASSTIQKDLARECRESASLLYVRSQYLKDQFSNLLQWICATDATLDQLTPLTSPDGLELLERHQRAIQETGRDHSLAEILRMLDQSGEEASEIEQLAATLEAIHDPSSENDLAQEWATDLLLQIRKITRGRLTTRFRLDSHDPESFVLPRLQATLFGSLTRLFAQRVSKPATLAITVCEGPSETSICLHIAQDAETDGNECSWPPMDPSYEPPLLELVRRYLKDQEGRIRVLSQPKQGGELHLEVRFPTENTDSPSHFA